MGCTAVTFNYASWTARFPEFTAVQPATAQEYWNEATVYWANPSLVVSKTMIQSIILNMLTAHIASLYSQGQGDPAPGQPKDANSPIGRINSATEGSVTVALQNDYPPGTVQWFQQTKYGSDFWAMTAQYRTARYIRGQLQPGGLPGPGYAQGYGGFFR